MIREQREGDRGGIDAEEREVIRAWWAENGEWACAYIVQGWEAEIRDAHNTGRDAGQADRQDAGEQGVGQQAAGRDGQ